MDFWWISPLGWGGGLGAGKDPRHNARMGNYDGAAGQRVVAALGAAASGAGGQGADPHGSAGHREGPCREAAWPRP